MSRSRVTSESVRRVDHFNANLAYYWRGLLSLYPLFFATPHPFSIYLAIAFAFVFTLVTEPSRAGAPSCITQYPDTLFDFKPLFTRRFCIPNGLQKLSFYFIDIVAAYRRRNTGASSVIVHDAEHDFLHPEQLFLVNCFNNYFHRIIFFETMRYRPRWEARKDGRSSKKRS